MTTPTPHTPGPWTAIYAHPVTGAIRVEAADGDNLAWVTALDGTRTKEIARANAVLIASAPDLLALVRDWLNTGVDDAGLPVDERAYTALILSARALLARIDGGAK